MGWVCAARTSSRLPPAFSMPERATGENASAENFSGLVSWPLPRICTHRPSEAWLQPCLRHGLARVPLAGWVGCPTTALGTSTP